MNARFVCIVLMALAPRLATAQVAPGASDSSSAVRLVPGARVRLTTDSQPRWAGRLVAVSDSSLVVHPDTPFAQRLLVGTWLTRDAVVDRRLLRHVEISATPGRRTTATLVGALAGAVAGTALGAMSVHNPCTDPSHTLGPCINRADGAYLGALAGIPVGMLVGRYVFGRDRWEPLSVERE